MDGTESHCSFEYLLPFSFSLFLFLPGKDYPNYRHYFLWIDVFIHGSHFFKEAKHTKLEWCEDLYCSDLLVGSHNFIAIDECGNSGFFGCDPQMLPAVSIGNHSDPNLRNNRFKNRRSSPANSSSENRSEEH